jgi:hypothetical protein
MRYRAKKQPDPNRFGEWWYEPERRVLLHDRKGDAYPVSVDEMRMGADVCLDVICQINRKPWVTREDAGNFLWAVHELVDPQRTLCPWAILKARAVADLDKKCGVIPGTPPTSKSGHYRMRVKP